MSDDFQFEIKGGYRTVYNQIVQPDRVFTVSRYFLDYWLPLLSPSLAWLIVAFRQRAFWNGQRDWCIVSQDRIAREAGISSRTARRQLSSAYMAWFLSGQARCRFRPDLGRKVYDISSYVVYQDDPLVPQHQVGLAALLAGVDGGVLAETLHGLLQLPAGQLLVRLDDPGAAPSPGLVKGTVKAVVERTCGLVVDEAGLTELCDRLHHHITAAGKVYVGTQYFRTEWLPQLGPALAWLVVVLRNDIFYNEQTGESRIEVTYPKQELAAAIGQTPRNLLNLINNKLAGVFFEINQQKSNAHTLTLKVRPWQGTQEALTPEDRQFVELSGYTPETAEQLNSAKDVLADSVSAAATGVESPANEPEILANGNEEKRPVESETNRKFWPMKAEAEILSARNEEKAPVEADELGKLAGTNRKNGPMEGKLEILADGNTEKEPVEGETKRKFWPKEAEVEKLAAGNQENGTIEDGEPEKMPGKNRKNWPMEGKAEILAAGKWNESPLEWGKPEILAAGNAEKGPVEGDINWKNWPEGKPEILAPENQEEPSSNEPKVEILADGNQEKEAVEGGENQKIHPVEEGKAEILADGNRKFWPLQAGKPEILAEHAPPQTGKNVRTQEDSLKTHGCKKTQQQQRFGADVTLSDWLGRLGEARGLKQQAVIVQELLAATSGQSLAASRISPLVEQYGARALAVAVYETGTLEGASAQLSREPCKIAAGGRSTPGLTKKQIRFYMQQLQIAAPTCNELAGLAWIQQPGYLAAWAAWFAGQHKYGPGWVVEQIRSELWPPQREDGPGAGREAVVAEVLRCYETEIGLITPEVFGEILSDIETYDLRDRELWDRAFERAVDQEVQEWASVRQMYLELRQETAPVPSLETTRAGPAPLTREWQVVLEILRGGMTRATYESIVQNSAWPIGRQNGSLVIGVASSQAWEWLENRWKPVVERAVKIAFGEELRVEFRLEAADDPGA